MQKRFSNANLAEMIFLQMHSTIISSIFHISTEKTIISKNKFLKSISFDIFINIFAIF